MAVYQNTSSVTFGDSFPSRGSLLEAFPLGGPKRPENLPLGWFSAEARPEGPGWWAAKRLE